MKKLSDQQVRDIRVRSVAGETNMALAAAYDITEAHVSNLTLGRARKSAPGPVRARRPFAQPARWANTRAADGGQ